MTMPRSRTPHTALPVQVSIDSKALMDFRRAAVAVVRYTTRVAAEKAAMKNAYDRVLASAEVKP